MPRLSRLASSALALALLIVPLVAYLMVDDGRLARMGFSLHAPRWSLLLASPTMIQIHVAAAVKHHFIDRDGLMARMLPGRG